VRAGATVVIATAAAPEIAAAVMTTATAASSAPALAAVALLALAAAPGIAAAGLAALAGGLPALGPWFAAVALATAMTVLTVPIAAISAGERLASTGRRGSGWRFFRLRFAAEKSLQPADEAAG